MENLEQLLTQQFNKHRILLWYDDQRELREVFDALDLPDVEKVVVENNAFSLKVRMLRQQPEQRFLLYHAGPAPDPVDNWLLDIELAYGTFHADRVSMWLSEIGLGQEYREIIAPHAAFFQSDERRQWLKRLVTPTDSKRQIKMAISAVCAEAEARLDSIMESLLSELAAGKEEKLALIERCGLADFLWKQVAAEWGYRSESPSLPDFAITLFDDCYRMGVSAEGVTLKRDAKVFLGRWQTSGHHRDSFNQLSARFSQDLAIDQDVVTRDRQDLVELDLFEAIDQQLLADLVQGVAHRTLAAGECAQIVRRRRQMHWYDRYRHPYEAVHLADSFLTSLAKSQLHMGSLAQGIRQYTESWYQLDQQYRQFIYHARQSGRMDLLGALYEQVVNHYTNRYLLPLNNHWQEQIDSAETWAMPPTMRQADFYQRKVEPVLNRKKKLYVIISDGLRYEAAEELVRRIRREDRYDAALTPMMGVLPSYTQLGMAALLPHQRLAIDNKGNVRADGASTQGTAARSKVLASAHERSIAIQAEDFMRLDLKGSREVTRNHDVVYLYHNEIDAVGDKRDSEKRVFEAVESTFESLIRLIKKLANANANNMIITADHGFLYQDGSDEGRLHSSDYVDERPTAAEVVKTDRRFVLGRGFAPHSSYKHFSAEEVGLDGDLELMLPKSINRLRVQGAGSRYVHGGLSLQEIVVPLIEINKKRTSDVASVEVDILRGTSNVISTGQATVAFYQTAPATAKRQPRTLQAGFYALDGTLISDEHTLVFDISAEEARERELRARFILTREADRFNGQEIELRLEEPIAGTSKLREYKRERYVLRRSFTSDF